MSAQETPPPGGKVKVLERGPIREIRLHRPEVHNALDEELIGALESSFRSVTREFSERADTVGPNSVGANTAAGPGPFAPGGSVRGVFLTGEGKSFCAGADVQYMQRVAGYGEAENLADARRLSAVFQAIRRCPVFVVARVQGAALGGGSGLIACCDLVVASDDAVFGFTEVQLGIVPAVISPFVLDRIGAAHARALFPTGERFSAADALRIGLVDRVVPASRLDETIQGVFKTLLSAAPRASCEAKRLIEVVSQSLPLRIPAAGASTQDPNRVAPAPQSGSDEDSVFELTARTIARLRAAGEGKEGLKAFLEKRGASWVEPPPDLTSESGTP